MNKEYKSIKLKNLKEVLKMKKLVSVIIIVALLVAIAPATVYAASEVSSSAKGKNQPPTVDAVTVYEATETSTTSALAPLIEFAVKLDITDPNKLKDVEEVKVTIWHDNTYASAPGTGDANGAAIFTWARVGDSWSLTSPSGTTWQLMTAGSPTSRSPSDKNVTTGSWWLHFQPSKVAKEADGTVGSQWYIHCYVVDKQAASATNEISGNSMSWYGELSNNAGTGVYFGEVEPGATTDKAIQEVNGTAASTFNLIGVSNGNRDFQVKADTTWVGDDPENPGSLTLGTDFTLKADDDGDVAGATSVSSGYATFGNEAGATSESGSQVTTGMWITVPGTTVVSVETYSGTLYFEIING